MSKLTSAAMRTAARSIREFSSSFICFALDRALASYPGAGAGHRAEIEALLRRDGYDTGGNFDGSDSGLDKQKRRAAWCDKIADELEEQELLALALQTR